MTPTEFLKKYTIIDHQFIDDFYTFYDEDISEFEYVINLDKVSNWLNVTKKKFKRITNKEF